MFIEFKYVSSFDYIKGRFCFGEMRIISMNEYNKVI